MNNSRNWPYPRHSEFVSLLKEAATRWFAAKGYAVSRRSCSPATCEGTTRVTGVSGSPLRAAAMDSRCERLALDVSAPRGGEAQRYAAVKDRPAGVSLSIGVGGGRGELPDTLRDRVGPRTLCVCSSACSSAAKAGPSAAPGEPASHGAHVV